MMCLILLGENIVDNFKIMLLAKARRDLEEIFQYLYSEYDRDIAEMTLAHLEERISSLETMPFRGALRKIGIFANQGYRQLFVKDFVIIYKVDIKIYQVVIITIRYSKSDF